MRDRNFLAEFLARQQQPIQTQQAFQQPTQIVDDENRQLISALQSQPSRIQGTVPLPELSTREALAKNLLEQANDRNAHPLARGIAAYFGSKELQDIGAEKGRTQEAIAAAEAEKERLQREEDIALKREGLDIQRQTAEAQERRFEQQAQLDKEKLKLDRDKFNAEAERDAQNNAITKIKSADGEVDLLFKGNAPVNDGLEKGQQWAVDKDGNRVTVPITTQPTEKAEQSKQMTLEVVNRLLANETGVRDNFGVFDQFTPKIQEATRQAATDLEQLKSLLTVENLGLMSGVLSETDIKILQNVSAAAFSEGATEKGAIRALKDLQKSLGSDTKAADKKDVNEFEGFKIKGRK